MTNVPYSKLSFVSSQMIINILIQFALKELTSTSIMNQSWAYSLHYECHLWLFSFYNLTIYLSPFTKIMHVSAISYSISSDIKIFKYLKFLANQISGFIVEAAPINGDKISSHQFLVNRKVSWYMGHTKLHIMWLSLTYELHIIILTLFN